MKMPPQRVVAITPEGFRALQRQIQALQEQMHHGMNIAIRDESEDEAEVVIEPIEEQEQEVLNIEEAWLFKAIATIEKRPKFDVPTFLENLNLEELIDWINELEEYFEYEEIEDPDRVKFAKAKLKGHAEI